MPFDFHKNRKRYFQIQTRVTEEYILPFIAEKHPLSAAGKVLEIGCGEGGVLNAFTKRGWKAVGVDLAVKKLNLAKQLMAHEMQKGQLRLIQKNIYEKTFKQEFAHQFDLIVMKDVIEHIPEQQNLLAYLHTFLKENGVIFIAFPPWYMPFGGHQQMCQSILKLIPWFHLLPAPLLKAMLRIFRENDQVISGIMANKRTGINIERFEKIVRTQGYEILKRKYYLFNPIYKYKFNIHAKEQWTLIAKIPYLRDFLTTGVYYLLTYNHTGK